LPSPAHHVGLRIVVCVAGAGEGRDFRLQRFLNSTQPQRDQGLDERHVRRRRHGAIVDRQPRLRVGRSLLVLRRLSSYSWHG